MILRIIRQRSHTCEYANRLHYKERISIQSIVLTIEQTKKSLLGLFIRIMTEFLSTLHLSRVLESFIQGHDLIHFYLAATYTKNLVCFLSSLTFIVVFFSPSLS